MLLVRLQALRLSDMHFVPTGATRLNQGNYICNPTNNVAKIGNIPVTFRWLLTESTERKGCVYIMYLRMCDASKN